MNCTVPFPMNCTVENGFQVAVTFPFGYTEHVLTTTCEKHRKGEVKE